MRRLISLIVLVFAFASVAGATTAHAHRYVSTPIVVLNHVDAQNQSIPVVIVVQRGEIDLGSGIVMPCGSHHAIPVMVDQLPLRLASCRHAEAADTTGQGWPRARLLRPPKTA